MQAPKPPGFSFPVGYRRFHTKQLYNYQLNRPFSLGYARSEDLAEAGERIGSFDDWKTEMERQAETALAEDRVVHAAFHFRAAEFFTFAGDPDKERFYDRFIELFRGAFSGCGIRRAEAPYLGRSLPIMELLPTGVCRGTILLHGGYDSFIEEFYSLMWFFQQRGYRVVGFEGPGQGAARRTSGLTMDFRWENPVGAVLDRLGLDDVTLIGLSMGGYFALRAAAFEKRITRVIASGHAYDYMKIPPRIAGRAMVFFHDRLRSFTNAMSRWKIRQGGLEAWNISHLMYVVGTDEPMAAMDFALQLTEDNLCSDRVTQDVLILASDEDHFIPIRLHREQLTRLTAARSVTDRVFTRRDQAHNHCQIGNIGLALRVMADWIADTSGEAR